MSEFEQGRPYREKIEFTPEQEKMIDDAIRNSQEVMADLERFTRKTIPFLILALILMVAVFIFACLKG